jgi:hypothetical protein
MTDVELPPGDGEDLPAPVELAETDEPPDAPPDDWDAEAHADEYATDPAVVVADDDGVEVEEE